MRLIDADKLIKELKEIYDDDLQKELEYLEIYEFIKEQPTAYNVDKVVEQLEENADVSIPYHFSVEKNIAIRVNEAIDIVKAGGIGE